MTQYTEDCRTRPPDEGMPQFDFQSTRLTGVRSQLRRNNRYGFRCGERASLTIHGFDKDDVWPYANTLPRVVKPIPENLTLSAAQFAVGKCANGSTFDIENRDADH